jgi:hypothetical protein
MDTTAKTSRGRADRRPASGFSAALSEFLLTLTAVFDSYRPERHYMRGPGPKWHAKHAPAPANEAVPELAHATAR